MASPNILTFTEANFRTEVLEASVPILVDFWAEWCGPCKMLAPALDELAHDFQGKARIGKVNIDDCQNLAVEYGVRAVPTLLIIKHGDVVDQLVGLKSKRDLKEALEKAIAS